MAKANTTDLVDVEVPAVAISLTEFCTRLSETVKRPELIGAFHSVEKAAGRVSAAQAAFRQRFDDFANAPV